MKNRELFLNKISIDDTFSMEIEPSEQKTLIIYENNTEIERFSLSKRIYTLFKTIQQYTDDSDFVFDKERKIKLYGQPIFINDHIYIKMNGEYESPALDFYKKYDNNEEHLIYITRINYMTQKLFNMFLIPERMSENKEYQLENPNEFKDLMDLLSVIKI